MSQRGRIFFDRYVREVLRHPMLAGLGLQSHVYNLLSEAREARLSRAEIEEEAGPLIEALAKELRRDEAVQQDTPEQKDKDDSPTRQRE